MQCCKNILFLQASYASEISVVRIYETYITICTFLFLYWMCHFEYNWYKTVNSRDSDKLRWDCAVILMEGKGRTPAETREDIVRREGDLAVDEVTLDPEGQQRQAAH